jgi:hypothetical protein
MAEGSAQAVPLVRITLRNGETVTVGHDGIHLGERLFALDDIQDARQVSPDPETIALRVAGRGMIEFQPAHAGEGQLSLEALFRLRPDLRPAGFEPPPAIPDWWPTTPPAATRAPEAGNLSTGSWPPPSSAFGLPPTNGGHPAAGTPLSNYGPAYDSGDDPGHASSAPSLPYRMPESADGRLTPYPRGILAMLGAAVRLYVARWRPLLLLGLAAAVVPAGVSGLLQMAFYGLLGFSPWGRLETATIGLPPVPRQPLQAGQIALLCGVAVGLFVTSIAASAWQIACLAPAGRNAILGKPVAARSGLAVAARQFMRVLITTTVVFGGALLAFLIPLGLILLSAPPMERLQRTQATSASSAGVDGATLLAAFLACGGFLLLVAVAVAVPYLFIRLVFAPYLVATDQTRQIGLRAALRQSWALTHRRWWHVALPLLAIWLIQTLLTAPLGNLELVSYPLELLLAVPLASAVLAPLNELTYIAVLYDLRLRREGYAALVHNE